MKNYSLAREAKKHVEKITKKYPAEIQAAIDKTITYGPEMPERRKPLTLDGGRVTLLEEDTVSCLLKHTHEGKVAVLNFADYKNPGGLFLEGSHAQEECLCFKSTLYPILSAFDSSYYAWNKQNLNRGLYKNRALYTSDVIFEDGHGSKVADVITCAAPNFYTAGYRRKISEEENNEVFKDRIRFMLTIAELNRVDTLIAGAWGCGVFAQNPYTTCEMFMDVFVKEGFNAIGDLIFAILGEGNYYAFKEVLGSDQEGG